MRTPTTTIDHEGLKIEIHPDEDAMDPRKDSCVFGKMICFHRRYTLGDKHEYNHEDYSGWDEMKKAIYKNEDAALVLPLYLYDHSGLRMKIGSFQGLLPQGHAEFDSGQVGFIFATRPAVHEEFGIKGKPAVNRRISKQMLEKAYKLLESEVEVYDQYLSGDVYGYVIKDEDGEDLSQYGKFDDSCWGFFGYDYCIEQAKEAATRIAPEVKAAIERLQKYGDGKGQLELSFE